MWNKSNFLVFFYVNTLNFQGTPEILIESLCQGEKQHAHTSCLHPKREALSEQRQNTGLWSQEDSTESVLPQRPSHVLPDRPPLEPGRNGACVNVYGPDKENTSSMGIVMVDWKIGCQGFFGSLLIFPVHLHNALHSLGQFLQSHKVVLLLHGLQKLGQLLKVEKNSNRY